MLEPLLFLVSAGTHVRNAATVGGNLALARGRRLESDLATVLMGAGSTVKYLEVGSSGDIGDARCAMRHKFMSAPAF